ncbi:MAG: hypothetical protein ACLQT7_09160 [Candidatus Dormibacteria bacterium]
MSHRITLPSLLAGAIAVVALAACGTSSAPSSSSSGSSPASGSSGSGGSISASSCPSASTVGSALGATVGSPTTVNEATGDLPSGATGIGCSYISGSTVVVVVLASGVPSSYFSTEEQAQEADLGSGLNISYTPISGLGDQAASYSYSAEGLTASGVIALKGSNVVGVFTDGLSTSVSSEESLVRSLL